MYIHNHTLVSVSNTEYCTCTICVGGPGMFYPAFYSAWFGKDINLTNKGGVGAKDSICIVNWSSQPKQVSYELSSVTGELLAELRPGWARLNWWFHPVLDRCFHEGEPHTDPTSLYGYWSPRPPSLQPLHCSIQRIQMIQRCIQSYS